jgi:hypothetical protein
MAKDMTHQRQGAVSNTHVGQTFEGLVQGFFAKQGLQLARGHQVLIGTAERKKRKNFDLGCDDAKIIVECKSSTWTKAGNVPSAKLKDWNSEMFHFMLAPTDYRKIMFVTRAVRTRDGESLAEYYLRLKGHLAPPNVEFWEYDEQTNEAVCLRSSDALEGA